jgi:acetylornithine deacetylase
MASASTSLALLDRLVSFDTVSSKSNLPLIDFVAEHLTAAGIPFVVAPNAAGDKAALYATIGPMVEGGVVLSGHTDVVPVEGQPWSSDPFTLRRDGTRLYGRGACDMKAFDAIALALAPDLARAPLKRPIHILLSYDEETTCLGVMDVIRRFGADLPRPSAVIVGEPTGMKVADAHKSVASFFTDVHGHEVHSSNPAAGASAIEGATMIAAELYRIADAMVARGDQTGRFHPPHTTVHIGTITGGTARNITARHCRLHWEFRGLPGLAETEIPDRIAAYVESTVLPRLSRGGAPARVVTEREVYVPGLAPDPGSSAETLAMRLAGVNGTITVAYGSEAGRFQEAGLATVLCGPGDIAQAHQPDEFIEIGQIEACEAFMRDLAVQLST